MVIGECPLFLAANESLLHTARAILRQVVDTGKEKSDGQTRCISEVQAPDVSEPTGDVFRPDLPP